MSSIKYYLCELWSSTGNDTTTKFPIISGSPWPILLALIAYEVSICVAKSKVKQRSQPYNLRPFLIPYFGFFFGCYSVGFVIATGLAKYGQISLQCFIEPDPFQWMLMGYLAFVFILFQLFHLVDGVLLTLAGDFQSFSGGQHLELWLMAFRCYFDMKFWPYGTSAILPLTSALIHSIKCSYLIRHYSSNELKPATTWRSRLAGYRSLYFIALAIHSIMVLNLPNCDVPIWYRGLQSVFAFSLAFAYIKDWATGSGSAKVPANENKKLK